MTYFSPIEELVYHDIDPLSRRPTVHTSEETAIETGIHHFFDVFARKASAHNESAKDGKLAINIRRPRYSGETIWADDTAQPVLNACLYAGNCGLFFFGYESCIDVYLLTCDEQAPLLFRDIRNEPEPLLTVTTRMGDGGREWYIRGEQLSREYLPELAQELLNYLVQAQQHQAQ